MPWFSAGGTGAERIKALRHLQYSCVAPQLNMRILVMVQPGELQECEELCAPMTCVCREVRHDRAYQHRNLAALANGKEHILYAHADMFLNLFRISALLQQQGQNVISPSHGLVGTNYQNTQPRCVNLENLNSSKFWFWHLNSKEECAKMLRFSSPAFGGQQVCCYGWVDMVYIPMHVHAEFSRMAIAAWDVVAEVALPTMFNAFRASGRASWHRLGCSGGCCSKLSWGLAQGSTCAHRVDLAKAMLNEIPPAVKAPKLCPQLAPKARGGAGGKGKGKGAGTAGTPGRGSRGGKGGRSSRVIT